MSLDPTKETEEGFALKIQGIDENLLVLNYTKKEVLCKACYIKYTYYSDIHLRLHIMSKEHINNIEKNARALENAEFQSDLAVAFSSADISLECLNNPVLKAFFEKYCGKQIPDDLSVMNENYAGLFDNKNNEVTTENVCLDCYDLSSDEDNQ